MGKFDKIIDELKKLNDGDDDTDDSDDDSDADDADASNEGDDSAAGDGEEKVSAGASVEKLVDKLGDKIVSAIEAKKGKGSSAEKQAVKSSLFGQNGGIQDIPYPADVTNLNKDEKIVLFFKSLINRKSSVEADKVFKALVEGTDAEGGYLVPEELRAEVFRVLPDFAVMRRIARVVPMASDTLLLNSLTAKPKAYWTAEYASKSTTSAEFNQVSLNANDLVCLLPVTHQLIQDANINIVQFIIELFGEAIGEAEDLAFFEGSGSGQPRGLDAETLTQIDAGLTLDFDDVIAAIHSVPQRVRTSPGTAFVANNYGIRQLRTLKDTTGRYIWAPGDPNNGSPERVYGYPIYEQNDIPQRQIFFGDFKYYIIGDRQQLSVTSTDEGGDAWRRNATEIKAVERVDGRAVITSPFVEIINA